MDYTTPVPLNEPILKLFSNTLILLYFNWSHFAQCTASMYYTAELNSNFPAKDRLNVKRTIKFDTVIQLQAVNIFLCHF